MSTDHIPTAAERRQQLFMHIMEQLRSCPDITPHVVKLRTEVNQNKSLSREDLNYLYQVLILGKVDALVPQRNFKGKRFTPGTTTRPTTEELQARIETITCIHSQKVNDLDEEGNIRTISQRCTNKITGTRAQISGWKSRCEEHRK